MSFLNPINEPVKRFSSTDASAPQINYNARVAGDVKTVLKACLVTGYGAKASAGWSIVNEVNHVAEFVSPAAAMSDYRLGIDDSSTSSTTWYYQYQDARTNPIYNTPTKSFSNIDKSYVDNGWQLLVTDRGVVFIESVQHTVLNKLSARITYYSQVKSALSTTSKNICFFNIGHNAAISYPLSLYSDASRYIHVNLDSYTSAHTSSATSGVLLKGVYSAGIAVADLVSDIYITNTAQDLLIGRMPAILSKIVNKKSEIYDVIDSVLNGRNVLQVCAGVSSSGLDFAQDRAAVFLIPLDYWEY